MLGRKSIHAQLCFSENFVGLDWFPDTDFSGEFPENWKEFNKICSDLLGSESR
jgi:restriction system protein